MCLNFDGLGITLPGGFAEYVVSSVFFFSYHQQHKNIDVSLSLSLRSLGFLYSRARKVFKFHNLTDIEATLTEPTACAIHGVERLQAPPGAHVLILGAGPTGTHTHACVHFCHSLTKKN